MKRFAASIVAATLALGCAATVQKKSVERSGFLQDYSLLKPGKSGQALLVYIAPDVDWKQYDAVMLDSVALWVKPGHEKKLSAEDQQRLTDYVYTALYKALSKNYRIVDKPGPGVMRVRAALTEAEGANVPLNAVTTIIPQLHLLSMATGLVSDTSVFVGEAAIEGEITDSISGKILAEAVDRRQGNKGVMQAFSKWGDVEAAADKWSEQLAQRLTEFRAGKE